MRRVSSRHVGGPPMSCLSSECVLHAHLPAKSYPPRPISPSYRPSIAFDPSSSKSARPSVCPSFSFPQSGITAKIAGGSSTSRSVVEARPAAQVEPPRAAVELAVLAEADVGAKAPTAERLDAEEGEAHRGGFFWERMCVGGCVGWSGLEGCGGLCS
jgi:hypothetical protein